MSDIHTIDQEIEKLKKKISELEKNEARNTNQAG